MTLFDAAGRPLPEVTYPVHRSSQATSLAWHPQRRVLASGWENGQVYAWLGGSQKEFSPVSGPHVAPIVWLAFSERGGRMVTIDAAGILTGWRCAESGVGLDRGGAAGDIGAGETVERPVHFLTMFTHDLAVPVLSLAFRQTVRSMARAELSTLARWVDIVYCSRKLDMGIMIHPVTHRTLQTTAHSYLYTQNKNAAFNSLPSHPLALACEDNS